MTRSRNIQTGKRVQLSPREVEVLKWAACGKTSEEIARLLELSGETVRSHLKTLCRKLHAANKTHATAIALVFGFIQVEDSRRGMVLPVLFGLEKLPKRKARRGF
ncbi:helix-turn-helix transcriptional regulator [Bradyrhizobium diazoefficiens]|nr:helix-turn-helix transcriptional regulator [Bradyrhizobium diazoefficiens]MBR0967862.1 helix-turn-helix transcriptional regulator [Bradyrhizobium diazoefficiens]MBR0981256.1 helix-turn-helix transcriptional regulator [Bradyrhizobium diazoefficiens]MBR1010713.1 helix-turn-helix transcriptional regulator [Bradyrhizobium diazoefficiens]MBR1015720.1 helix-turn-helix transcriptional regulator [Bradyrhizobium diazoefficiens]MBR1054706.1 helix-turn-helix transcriptional regulator [Bradyrhizobium d